MYKGKEIIHIVAVDENMGIGKDNKLLYSIPKDLQYFRENTLGHSLLCGRKTYESFPKPLDRRIVQVVANRSKYKRYALEDGLIEGLYSAKCNSDLLNTDKIFIVGGASLYEQTADVVDTLLITEIKSDGGYGKEADTFYTIPKGFVKVWEGVQQVCTVNGVVFKHTKWKKEDK